MDPYKVHTVRFYNIKSQPIHCMAIQHEMKLLAISRSNASIEIWNLQHAVFIERTIPSIPSNYTIEGLTWYNSRLFSVGLHGFLVEYDLKNITIKEKWALTGQSAFCIDSSLPNKQLAIGTEQGYINIYSLEDYEVVFHKFVDKQEGRIICLKYDPSGKYLIGGSLDAIRVWDVKTGHALHKMTTGRSANNQPTIVWCLSVTDDLTIISGDSRGRITFWDGLRGGQLESYQSHKADILSICLSNDKRKFYCAGIDPKIASYELSNVSSDNPKWIMSMKRNVHDYDVRALVMFGEKLFSGGADGYLSCSYFPPKALVQFPPVLHGRTVSVAKDVRYVLLRYNDYLELWTICPRSRINEYNKLEDTPKKILILQRKAKNDLGQNCNEGITCADIANNGKWIAFSTDKCLRLFSLNYDRVGSEPILKPIELMSMECGPCVNMKFTSKGSQLIVATRDETIVVINLFGTTPSVYQTINLRKYLEDICSYLLVSECEKYLLVADCKSNIIIWKYFSESWDFYCKLPKNSAPITALSFHVQAEKINLFIVYSNHKVIEYDVFAKKITSYLSYTEGKSKYWNNILVPIKNIIFDPNKEDSVILHDDSHISVYNKNMESEAEAPGEKKKKSIEQVDENKNTKSLQLLKVIGDKYKHLIYFDSIGLNEVLAVEVTPDLMKEDLPESFKAQSAFGRR